MDPRWRALVDATPLAVIVVDRNAVIVEVNRTEEPFSRADVVGKSVFVFAASEETEKLRAQLEQALAGVATKTEMRASDGRSFMVQSVPVFVDERVHEVLFLCEDSTSKDAQAEALARRERVFRALVENSSDGFALISEDARFLYASPSTARLFGPGYEKKDPFSLVHPDDRAMARTAFARVTKTKQPVHVRVRVLTADGPRTLDAVLVDMSRCPDVAGIVANFHDVTELESVRHERERFFELSADLLCVIRPDGGFERVNAAWEATLGWTSDELTSRTYLDLVHPDDRTSTAEKHAGAMSGSVATFENRCACSDGSYRWMQWKSAFDPMSGLFYSSARDITEKRRVDERLLHAQKMEAVGRLAGGVAHDINNTLAVIYSSTELLLSEMAETEPARSDILDIQEAAQRSAALVRQLLAIGRKRLRSVQELVIDEAVGPLAKMIARCAGPNVHVIARPGSLAKVRIDPSELESIVMNLALNARDAMPEGGTIEMTTRVRQMSAARASELGVEPGRYVALSVRDTGCGIPAELRHKVFEPFFTTKAPGKGTGLGLATVFGVVEQCGGAIEIDSTEGVGTTIHVFLPSVKRSSSRSRPAVSAPPA